MMHQLLNSALDIATRVAYLPSHGRSISTDGKDFWSTFHDINKLVEKIENNIANNRFKFDPFLRIIRTMKSGKDRIIYMPTWRDKIVDRWLSCLLNTAWKDKFSKHSYAYRDDLGIDTCCDRIAAAIHDGNYVLKRDIAQYYYTIDKELLIKKLSEIKTPFDHLIRDRIYFSYIEEHSTEIKKSDIGIAFGSPLSCVLANIYLTSLDYEISSLPVRYFRYADDFLIISKDRNAAIEASDIFNRRMTELKLSFKPSHSYDLAFENDDRFKCVSSVNHLGLIFSKNHVRLSIVKFRKILNIFKREYRLNKGSLGKCNNQESRLKFLVDLINSTISNRIRGVAIIDYYLKHVDDELQLRQIDRWIAEFVISKTLRKPFRKGMFRAIPFKKLRDLGLISIVHRGRLIRHGKIKIRFIELMDVLRIDRNERIKSNRDDKLNIMKAMRKKKSK